MSGNGIGITRTWRLRSARGRGGVVLDVHRGHVAAGTAARPPGTQRGLVRVLQHQDVDVVPAQFLERDLFRIGPRPARQAAAFGITIAGQRDQVPMPARHERLRPGPVQMPPAPL
ncbi:hypothetical protein [Mycobacterium kansasii]|uniref:hypothetical protein n=1 Tax=Mycobacterium kansasii TaxID=1768 RepID=UPI000CDE2CA6|nr:hypothetical protein [Mycobacterium kansasii]POX76349.1 hypothetical protein C3470_24290 [Mycobacterium kansasii]POY02238.1 hypothetical protein C3479_09570 [Mycobacterium kansasii]POY28816.1 hypothetical protein C3469_05760 [Mycobacterium kansasii]